jgi:hypothetical protein
MKSKSNLPEWSPRVPKSKIRKLYELDTKGIYDEELIEDVGYTLLSRCKSFIEANLAVSGKATCPICRAIVNHGVIKDETLRCGECDWELTWGEYFATIQRKQLSGAEPVIRLFKSYVHDFPRARSFREKVYLIDRLIHGFHWNQKHGATRPVAVNLIEGRLSSVIEFLDDLSHGDMSTPGVQEMHEKWQKNSRYARSWALKKEEL